MWRRTRGEGANLEIKESPEDKNGKRVDYWGGDEIAPSTWYGIQHEQLLRGVALRNC